MLPDEIDKLYTYDLKEFRIQDIQPGTIRFEKFNDKVKDLSSRIATAINDAPPYDASWEEVCKERFNAVYDSTSKEALALIESFKLKCQDQQLSVPRVIL